MPLRHCSLQSSVQSLDQLDHGLDMRDNSAESYIFPIFSAGGHYCGLNLSPQSSHLQLAEGVKLALRHHCLDPFSAQDSILTPSLHLVAVDSLPLRHRSLNSSVQSHDWLGHGWDVRDNSAESYLLPVFSVGGHHDGLNLPLKSAIFSWQRVLDCHLDCVVLTISLPKSLT